jgi:hypothetical protein
MSGTAIDIVRLPSAIAQARRSPSWMSPASRRRLPELPPGRCAWAIGKPSLGRREREHPISDLTLVLRGVELRIGCAAPEYGFEFPGEIDRVADPGIHSPPAGRYECVPPRGAETCAVSGNAAPSGDERDRSKTNLPFRPAPTEALKRVDWAIGRSPVSSAPGSQKRCVR